MAWATSSIRLEQRDAGALSVNTSNPFDREENFLWDASSGY